jgi:hypothetical protein
MQFEIILIVFGFLTLFLLWFINILVGYLKIASELKRQTNAVIDSITLLTDINYSCLLTLDQSSELSSFIQAKNNILINRNSDLIATWSTFLPVLDSLNQSLINLDKSSDLSIKLGNKIQELSEIIHLYNQEVIIFQKKQQKGLFSLFNKVFLRFDLAKIQPLSH